MESRYRTLKKFPWARTFYGESSQRAMDGFCTVTGCVRAAGPVVDLGEVARRRVLAGGLRRSRPTEGRRRLEVRAKDSC